MVWGTLGGGLGSVGSEMSGDRRVGCVNLEASGEVKVVVKNAFSKEKFIITC